MANPFTGLLRKLGLRKAPEGTPPPQLGVSGEGVPGAPTNLGEGDKLYGGPGPKEVFAPNTGIDLKGTSLASLPTRESSGVPAAPEAAGAPTGLEVATPAAPANPEAASPTAPVSPEGALPVK